MNRLAAAIVLSLAAASALASGGCKRFRRTPSSIDAGSTSTTTTPASTAPTVVGSKPGSETCEEYVVVAGALDARSVCIKDFGAPLTIEIAYAKPAVTTNKLAIDPKELVLETAQKELTLDAAKVTSPTKRMPFAMEGVSGELTFALSKRAALAVLEKMLDDFAKGKAKNPIPKSTAPLKKGKELTLVFLKLPEHGGKTGETLKDLKPGGRLYLRYGNTEKVRDFDKVVIAREGKEVFTKAECRYFTLGGAGDRSTFVRYDVPIDVFTYDRGVDSSKAVKHFAAAKECPPVIDMDQAREHYSVRVLPPLDKILEYVRAI